MLRGDIEKQIRKSYGLIDVIGLAMRSFIMIY